MDSTRSNTAAVSATRFGLLVFAFVSLYTGPAGAGVQRSGGAGAETLSSAGVIDAGNEFFQELGTNGRTCESCHMESNGWSVTPKGLRARFSRTEGLDPIFRPHDGANAPGLDVSTVDARRAAYSLMLKRGVIRVGLPVKATSEFELMAADDPYGFASSAQLSLFRRPLPTTNLRFVTAVNWDGRNTVDPPDMLPSMLKQANGATVNHAQAFDPISDTIRASIADFETGLYTALIVHEDAGRLDVAGARGGAAPLLDQPFFIGINDPDGLGFDRHVFNLYDAWRGKRGARGEIAAGQRLFNERRFDLGNGASGTCSSCHSVPNVGNYSTFEFFDVGVSAPERRKSDVPLYTFRNKTTGETLQTTDPGRALITGLWSDMNRFKVPALRGLAARAPYFHDGSARTLRDVVKHYDDHFSIGLSREEEEKLVAFLKAL